MSYEIRSAIPGRVRWHVPPIRDDARVAALVAGELRARDGILAADANPISGRVLVRFHPEISVPRVSGWLEEAVDRALLDPDLLPHEPLARIDSPISQLVARTRRHRSLANKAIAISFASKALEATPPFMIGLGADIVTRGPASVLGMLGIKTLGAQLFALGSFGFALWVMDAFVSYVQASTSHELATIVRHELRTELYEKLQRLDLAQLESRNVGQWMLLLSDDIEHIYRFIKEGVDPIVTVAASGAIVLTTFAVLSPQLAATKLLLVPPVILASTRLLKPIRMRYGVARGDLDRLTALLHGNISGMATITSFATQEAEAERTALAGLKHIDSLRAANELSALYVPTLKLIIGAGFITTMTWGGAMVASGALTVGAYNAMGYSELRLFAMLGRLGIFLDDYQRTLVSLKRITDVLSMEPSIVSGPRRLPAAAVRGDINFDDVDFAYTPDRKIFNNLSLRFPAGATVGIVGASGAGKSTLLKLLQRFYDVQAGSVRLDGEDIRDLRLHDLRCAIATVPQEIAIFAGTIRDNIAYGKPHASDADVITAARAAEAHEFIEALPAGYGTRVGYGGLSLSAGQRQRLAIARVVLADRPILLFDEATSALDHHTEASVQRSLHDLTADRTTVIVAHRLAMVRHADLIYVLDDGEVRESGSHDELVKAEGVYASMWRVQTGEALGPRRDRNGINGRNNNGA